MYMVNGTVMVNDRKFYRIDYVGPDAPSGLDFLQSPTALVSKWEDAECIADALNARRALASTEPQSTNQPKQKDSHQS